VSRSTVALVHGAWHGAWCWDELGVQLEKLGHRAIAVDLPAEDPAAGLQRYAELTSDAIGDADDVVLVGHSLGGASIPLVTALRPVRQLVFLCALIPEPGRSVTDRYREEDVFVEGFAGNTETRDDGASFWPAQAAAIRCFYHDCTPDDAAWAAGNLRAQAAAPSREVWPLDAMPDVDRTSIICRHERCISPGWSRTMSVEQLGVQPVELDGGHSPFLARPTELAKVIARVL
jgi:pimeloyl-ACP methyl ester carboxylesterase